MHTYYPKGVCSRQMNVEINENGIITECDYRRLRRQYFWNLSAYKGYECRRSNKTA